MATLDKETLTKILKKPQKAQLIKEATGLNERLLRFTDGTGSEKVLKKVEYIDQSEMYEARKKLRKSIVDLYERIIKLRGKVFSAKGGSRVIPLNEKREKELIAYLNSIRNGLSLRKYIEQSLIRAWDSDPMGICFVEISSDPENPLPYPTYKNISCIYDYYFTWRNLDYVIFNLTKEEINTAFENQLIPERHRNANGKFMRVVDDARDYYILYSGDGVYEEISESITPNPWGRVPGFIISDIPDKKNERMISTIECVIELSERYMERDADIALQEKLHGTLKYWTQPVACSKCGGSGLYEHDTCDRCKGTKVELKPKVSTTLIVPENTNETKYNIPPAGYIAPPKESFDLIQSRLTHYEQLMMETYWGQTKNIRAEGPDVSGNTVQTATEVLQTNSKEEIMLNQVSDWAQETEEYLVDFIGEYLYSEFGKASVSYGRRYVIKLPDELRKSYESTRSQKLAESIMDDAYADYIESKYEKDPVQLTIQYKLFQIEPFFHYSLSELKNVISDPELIKRKAYFGEWKKQKTDMELFSKDVKVLQNELESYVSGIEINEQSTAGNNEQVPEVGKLPLALQQLALAKQRSIADGDQKLANEIEKKMFDLVNSL